MLAMSGDGTGVREAIASLIAKKRHIGNDVVLIPAPLTEGEGFLSTEDRVMDFAKALCGMLNGPGGTIVFGVDFALDTPHAITGLSMGACADIQELCERLIEEKIAPQPPSDLVSFESLPVADESCLLAVRVLPGPMRPYAILPPFKGYEYGALLFYAYEAGKLFPMDVSRVAACTLSPESPLEKMETFCDERITALAKGRTPLPLVPTAKLVFPLLPLSSFEGRARYDLGSLEGGFSVPDWAEEGRFSTQGYLSSYSDYSYLLFRYDGVVEAVDGFYLKPKRNGERTVPVVQYQTELMKVLDTCVAAYRSLSVPSPVYASLALVGVKEYAVPLKTPRRVWRIEDDIVRLPITRAMDDLYSFRDRQTVLLNDLLELLWGASGAPAHD
jgi:hypothetical protein